MAGEKWSYITIEWALNFWNVTLHLITKPSQIWQTTIIQNAEDHIKVSFLVLAKWSISGIIVKITWLQFSK
jgi:hypothetical protein